MKSSTGGCFVNEKCCSVCFYVVLLFESLTKKANSIPEEEDMPISEKEFRGARAGDCIVDAQGLVITITRKREDVYSTVEVDHSGIEKLRWFEGKIVDSEFGADVDINHPNAHLVVMPEAEVW